MSWDIEVNADQSVRYVSRFKKGRGSLSALGASGLVEYVNALDRAELFAVVLAVKSNPFPLGAERETLTAALAVVREPDFEPIKTDTSDGDLRKAMVLRYCQGFNAPGDSYLRAMVRMKRGE